MTVKLPTLIGLKYFSPFTELRPTCSVPPSTALHKQAGFLKADIRLRENV
jgi:hypothetical protein